ncbi:PEP-CTERM sorting domain-containing protein [Methyloversatilis thermotolerans]|uniref:PEP-CTERM sorting domain-containing protein n=1 Tax=Methyloversatilis thermotolerans TaxID=1346290 RepID=UPI0012FCB7BD|nr:PEP-CTERM sorting domain-containing protein [Methyloversatilis thermotolerans]
MPVRHSLRHRLLFAALLAAGFCSPARAVNFEVLFDGFDYVADFDDYELKSGSATVNSLVVGDAGAASFLHSGGTLRVTDTLTLGMRDGSVGVYSLSGGSLLTSKMWVGAGGSGSFLHNGGGISVSGRLYMNGTYLMQNSSSVLLASGGVEVLGGTMLIYDGAITGNVYTVFSSSTNGPPTIKLFGGELNGNVTIDTGKLTLEGGTISGNVTINRNDGLHLAGGRIDGTLILNAGVNALSYTGTTFVGGLINYRTMTSTSGESCCAPGVLDIGSGGFDNRGTFYARGRINSAGQSRNSGTWRVDAPLTLGGTGGLLNSGILQLSFGEASNVTLEQSAFVLANTGQIQINGARVNGNGRLENRAGGRIEGYGNIDSVFAQQGSLLVANGTLNVSRGFINTGAITVNENGTLGGGEIDSRGSMQVYGKVNSAVRNSGSLMADVRYASPVVFGGNLYNEGVMEVRGGTVRLDRGMLNRGTVNVDRYAKLGGGEIDNRGSLNVAGTVSGDVLNTGRIDTAPPGTDVLFEGTVRNQRDGLIAIAQGVSGSSTRFTGPVTLATGSRLETANGASAGFSGLLTLMDGSRVSLASGSRLDLLGDVMINGRIDVDGSGWLAFLAGSSLDFDAITSRLETRGGLLLHTTTLDMDLDISVSGTRRSQRIDAESLAIWNSTLALNLNSGITLREGDRFDLLDWTTFEGDGFSRIDTSGVRLADGLGWDFSQLYTTGEIAVVAVPEANTWAMLLVGLAVLGLSTRRKQYA